MSDLVKDRADWLLDAVACSTQNRMFLRGDPKYDDVAGESILFNAEKAMREIQKAVLDDTDLKEGEWLFIPKNEVDKIKQQVLDDLWKWGGGKTIYDERTFRDHIAEYEKDRK